MIALLAQVGGLGVITFTTMFMLILRRRIGMKERLLIQDAYNLDTIQGLVVLVKKILKGTLVVETVGALLYMTVFIKKMAGRESGILFLMLCPHFAMPIGCDQRIVSAVMSEIRL